MTAPQITTVTAPTGRGGGRLALGVLRALVTFVAVTGILLALWVLFLDHFDVNAYVGKTPSAVWEWITDAEEGSERQAELWAATTTTLTEAGWGFVTGIVSAVLVAVAFTLSKALERTFLPIALALRSVPIVAMVPLFAYIFGRGTIGSLVIISIITFFPALVLVSNGLRAVRPEAVELLIAYNAGSIRQLLKLRLPSALPSLMASAKVCAPLAILGSILNGWLSTGTGLGALMVSSTITAQYAQLWAAVVVVTVASIVFAALVSVVEQPVLARFAPDRLAASDGSRRRLRCRPVASRHPLLVALEPVAAAIGATLVGRSRVRADDIPLEWEGQVVGGLRLPARGPGLASLIEAVEAEVGGPLASLSREDKQRAVALLDERGAFAYRRSVEDVADSLGVSRFTVYNYLNARKR